MQLWAGVAVDTMLSSARPLDTLTPPVSGRPSRLDRLFNSIERIGDRIPDPFMLFVYLTIMLALVSTIAAASGRVRTHPG